ERAHHVEVAHVLDVDLGRVDRADEAGAADVDERAAAAAHEELEGARAVARAGGDADVADGLDRPRHPELELRALVDLEIEVADRLDVPVHEDARVTFDPDRTVA